MRLIRAFGCAAILPLIAQAPAWRGDPDAQFLLEVTLEASLSATEAFGLWPKGRWQLLLHPDAASFAAATSAPPQRGALWIGSTLHLRPWEQLRRRDLGAVLRHELVHRRLLGTPLRRWEEEARCLWAEDHSRPPECWPEAPEPKLQDRLDRALTRGITAEQGWAYTALRHWLRGEPMPKPPAVKAPSAPEWKDEPLSTAASEPTSASVRVIWPPERMPSRLTVNGRELRRSAAFHTFTGTVRFGEGAPLRGLEGRVDVRWVGRGWELTWWTDRTTWVAAAVQGELGPDAPLESRRALAAVLNRWLVGQGTGRHETGALCPLTHCAVVRGMPDLDSLRMAATAPRLAIEGKAACFTGSAGGVCLSPMEVWGDGPERAGTIPAVPGDRWSRWERTFSPAQLARLKAEVSPGLRTGQKGLLIGRSGPYAIEALRIAAGRAFGWTSWPSNACEAEVRSDGALHVQGRGWGHNAGLCLTRALDLGKAGASAEVMLREAFGAEGVEN